VENLPNCTTWLDHLNGDKDGNQNIIFEFVTDHSLWIWDAFFSYFRINNDVNVLNRSPLIGNLLRGEVHDWNFFVNGNTYPCYYFLVDGIYPR